MMLRRIGFTLIAVLFVATSALCADVARWDIFELKLNGPSDGNPFADVQLSAEFRQGDDAFKPEGFYDGDGVYKVRFMPNKTGKWTYVTHSNREELNGKKGSFTCTPAGTENHGPVRVRDTFQLAYEDGTPHFSVGTTCYAWVHQGDEMEERTLETLKNAPFNKMRVCVFPKAYRYNFNEPVYYPYRGEPKKEWDFKRFNPEFWRHFEKRVGQLRDMGIEADIIVFHPYDRWDFSKMGHENNLFYLHYLVARLAAYRNVWWSFANEYDFLKWPIEWWDEYFQVTQKIDPYNHLRGIHNGRLWYDHTHEWVTHASLQTSDFSKAQEHREKYQKPIVFDECKYEGDIPEGWGNISAEQMTRDFWMGSLSGCYVGHGETYKHPEDVLWWSKGGVLHGQSPARIQYMKEIIEALPYWDMKPDFSRAPDALMLAQKGKCYLMYFTTKEPISIDLPGDAPYKLDGVDTWNMTTIPLGSVEPGAFTFTPPKRDYAIRLLPYAPGEKMRPQANASADRSEGLLPLTVRFSTPWNGQCRWDFGDGRESSEKSTTHIYTKAGLYMVTLTVTDDEGVSCATVLPVRADRDVLKPVVRIGFPDGDFPNTSLHGGKIERLSDGSYDLGSEEPFSWIEVGDSPVEDIAGVRSFTITGWLKAQSLKTGSGGNRILFNLQHDRSGVDLVHLEDGTMRLAVNEWPDRIRNDSSKGKIAKGEWVFFAVTYDSSKAMDCVRWYFGDEKAPAELDCVTDYNNGPVDEGNGNLAIGNFNSTLRSAGLDRQFRGRIRALQIFTSYLGERGALSLEEIQKIQKM